MGIARNLARIIADNSGAIAAGNLSNAAPTPGLTNRISNGAFNVWQRGTSFTSVASGQYTADRWQISYRPAGVTVARQDNTTYYAARLTNTDGSPQSFDFEQRIEDVTQFNNSNYVMSFNAKSSASVTVTAQIYVNYGSGGSSQDTCNVVNVSVTTTRTGFSVSLPFPNMSGKTIGANNYVQLNSTGATAVDTTTWNNTSPTSNVFSMGGISSWWPASTTMVAYCWAEIAGFSRFGSYTGNGNANGSFIYTGFQPKFVMIKRTDAIENWVIWTPLSSGNGIASSNNFSLFPNLSRNR